jgi:hypothetical protein
MHHCVVWCGVILNPAAVLSSHGLANESVLAQQLKQRQQQRSVPVRLHTQTPSAFNLM